MCACCACCRQQWQGQAKAWHAKLPIASLSKAKAWHANSLTQASNSLTLASQGKTCRGTTCQGKACQASNSLTLARHAKAKARDANAMHAKAKPRQGMPRPRHAKAKARHANAMQGKACQG
ncbi:MAG: hypothetical protein J6586_08125 [Snodgrassella sp.]|nr:hypothetical protein [Snodgrassella sp.]